MLLSVVMTYWLNPVCWDDPFSMYVSLFSYLRFVSIVIFISSIFFTLLALSSIACSLMLTQVWCTWSWRHAGVELSTVNSKKIFFQNNRSTFCLKLQSAVRFKNVGKKLFFFAATQTPVQQFTDCATMLLIYFLENFLYDVVSTKSVYLLHIFTSFLD
jgi:hypothetical protein